MSQALIPDRRILILLYDIGASAQRWSYVNPALSRNYRVIVPDIIGMAKATE